MNKSRFLIFLLSAVSMSHLLAHSEHESCDAFMDFDNATMRDAAPPPWRASKPDDRVEVLENQHAKVTVWPYAGGAITEYIQKSTGTNFVAGKVEPGRCYYGWKEITRVNGNDPTSEWFGSLPHQVRRVQTKIGPGLELACRRGDLESRRVLVLDPDSGKLTITVRLKNVGKTPRRLFLRWHPHMMVGDEFAESSGVFVPDANGNLRQIKVGIGWDNSFIDPRGFLIAANWKSGEGLWMAYDPRKVPLLTTWTDYKRSKKHPLRGAFTVEPWLLPELSQPGESQELTVVYFPFTLDTPAEAFPGDPLPEGARQEEARRFARLVKPHFELLGQYSMVPTVNQAAPAVKENRFWYSHRRRDRFALREWGIADALFSMPGVQSLQARARFFATLFPEARQPVNLEYHFFIRNMEGELVNEQVEKVHLTPEKPVADLRREWKLETIPDGTYHVGVEIFAPGEAEPFHRVVETRRLAGARWAELAKERSVPKGERPFVTALRHAEADLKGGLSIPIGIEEAAGFNRSQTPVYVGVPFAKGAVRHDSPLRLLNAAGQEIGYDRRVSGTWEDGSVRWMLLDFLADVPADGHVFYSLKSGASEVPREKVLLRESAGAIVCDEAAGGWKWSRDGDGRGMLGPVDPAGLWWTAGDGTRYLFRASGEEAGVKIETNGAYRAVVRVNGAYFAQGREKPVAKARLRFTMHRGERAVNVEHHVTFVGDPWKQKLGSYGIAFPLPSPLAGGVETELDGQRLELGNAFRFDQFRDDQCRVTVEKGVTKGGRGSGGFSIPMAAGKRAILLRDFWRLFPKEVSMSAGANSEIVFTSWPESKGGLSFLPREDGWLPSSSSAEEIAVGMSRSVEYRVVDNAADGLAAMAQKLDEPVLAIVPPRYLLETDAMRHLQPSDPERRPELEKAVSDVFDSYLLGQKLWGWYGHWTYGTLPNLWLPLEQRWADFGRYAHLLNELDAVQTPWLAWMRSGDRKYYRFAEANTRQLMEVSTIAWNEVWPEHVGLSRRHHECVWLGTGDYGHSMLDPFLEMYRMTGHEPAWEAAQAMAAAMARQDSPDHGWRYLSNPLAGLSRMALETQDPDYRNGAERIWKSFCAPDRNRWWATDHGDRAVIYYSQLDPEAMAIWKASALEKPEWFTGMDAMTSLFLKTGDQRYAKAAVKDYQMRLNEQRKGEPDSTRIGLGGLTQHILQGVRGMFYVGPSVDAVPAKEGETSALPNSSED